MTPSPVSTHPIPVSQSTPWIAWGAVIAGLVVTAAVQIGLSELAVGTGLSFYEPTDPGSEGGKIAFGTVVGWVVAGLVAVFLGGWVAGRMKRHGTRIEAGVHGALVWASWAIVGLLLAMLSVGAIAGGAVSLLGQGVSAAGTVAGSTLGAAGEAVGGLAAPTWDAVKDQVKESTSSTGAANQAGQPGQPAQGETRFADQSRLMQLLGNSFSTDANAGLSAADQQELNTLVAAQLGISPEAARKTTDQWQRSWRESVDKYQAAKEEAKRKALEAASVAKKRTAQLAITAFALMLAGLISAVCGALAGNACVWTKAREEGYSPDAPARPAYT